MAIIKVMEACRDSIFILAFGPLQEPSGFSLSSKNLPYALNHPKT